MAKASGGTRTVSSANAASSRKVEMTAVKANGGVNLAESNKEAVKDMNLGKYDANFYDGHIVSESTPQKLDNLEKLASNLGIDKKYIKLNNNAETSPVPSGYKTSWGEPIMEQPAKAAEMVIKTREGDSFKFGARMFVKPTDDGYYILSTSNKVQSWKKNDANYPKFKEGTPLSKKQASEEIKKFKKFYEM